MILLKNRVNRKATNHDDFQIGLILPLCKMLMKRLLACPLLCFFVVTNAHAWSAKGHAMIAQNALQQLSPQEQHFFNQQSMALLKKERKKKWKRHLKKYSAFAQAAVWPDVRREMTLQALFDRYAKKPVPPNLRRFGEFDTRKWHYVNAAYWDLKHQQLIIPGMTKHPCRLEKVGLLEHVWPSLVVAFSEVEQPVERGIILAFLSHLLGDAFQPLHTFAATRSSCETDAGGNKYCLDRKGQRCQLNLHRLWDSGFGVFYHNGKALKKRVVTFDPLTDINFVVKANRQFAQQVYSLPESTLPSPAYKQSASKIVQAQQHLASETLAILLKALYQSSRNK